QGSSFQRARRYGSGSRLWVYVFGGLSAFFPLFLLVCLSYLVQVLIDPAGERLPRDLVLGRLLARGPIEWPVESAKTVLLWTTAASCVIALLQGLSVVLLRRAAHWGARQAAAEMKTAIHRQA